jgi:hypothetical protein
MNNFTDKMEIFIKHFNLNIDDFDKHSCGGSNVYVPKFSLYFMEKKYIDHISTTDKRDFLWKLDSLTDAKVCLSKVYSYSINPMGPYEMIDGYISLTFEKIESVSLLS